ncbi:MAG: hypothetical protein ACKOUD_01955 [Rhodoluna sp.]
MSYLAYPPRLTVEFSESIAQLINLTLKIKNEVAPHKNEFNQSMAKWGWAPKAQPHKPRDAKSALLNRQKRKSRYWVAFAGETSWINTASIESDEKLALSQDLLKHLEALYLRLQRGDICPLTKVSTLKLILTRRPILSIRQLADDALISESTAKRWLRALERDGLLSSLIKDGQRQFINDDLIAIIETYI